MTYREAIHKEADSLRSGIRSGRITCDCAGKKWDEPHKCYWSVAVTNIYKHERELESADSLGQSND